MQRLELGGIAEIRAVRIGTVGREERLAARELAWAQSAPAQIATGSRTTASTGTFWIQEMMNEGGVRAVLEQAPHEIRQQILVRAHRRVGAHSRKRGRACARDLVKRLAHAVQALELEFRAARRQLEYRGDA